MHPPAIEEVAVRPERGPDFQLREDHAYLEGLRAYAWGFPWLYMATLRYLWTNVPQDRMHVPYAPLNRFWHMRRLADAWLGDGARPNNDTPYSVAWLDLTAEPIIFSHRDMGQRYFAFDLIGMGLDRFASVGSRPTGPAGGAFAIRGPDWQGSLPAGIVPLPRSQSNSVLVIGRTEAHGASDMPAVRDAQSGYRLVPLSRWPDLPLPPESRAVLAPNVPFIDPLADWKTLNGAITADPPHRTGRIESWAHLGIGAGIQVETQPEPVRRGLARAAAQARRTIGDRTAAWDCGDGARADGWTMLPVASDTSLPVGESGGWLIAATAALACHGGARRDASRPIGPDRGRYPRLVVGRAGLEVAASLTCNLVHAPVEFAVSRDAAGVPLVGGRSYRLQFAPGGLPPARYFWSVSMYDSDGNLIPTKYARHSTGSRTPGFRLDPDGGATIPIGPTPPWDASNWLSGPVDRRAFTLVLRLYAGDRAAIAATWRPPAVEPDERYT